MSHRPSFPIPGSDNDFYTETFSASGDAIIIDTGTTYPARPSAEMLAKFDQHAADGYHLDCVICQSDPRTAMELRSNVISRALKDSDWMDAEQRESLWQELDEIHAWLQKDNQPADLGVRVTIVGGEVVELDAHLESAYDDRNGDGYDF
jgi:hypothetical protein